MDRTIARRGLLSLAAGFLSLAAGCTTVDAREWDATGSWLRSSEAPAHEWEAWARSAESSSPGLFDFKGGVRWLDEHTALLRGPGGRFAVELGPTAAQPDARVTADLQEPGQVVLETQASVWSISPGSSSEVRGATTLARVYIRTASSLLVVDAKRRTFLEFPERR